MNSKMNGTSADASHGQNEEPIDIAIVGGGISGLCLALGILNHAPHIRFHIYEAAEKFAEIGAGVAFGINAQRALHKLAPGVGEAYSRLRTSNVDFNVKASAADDRDGRKETYLRVVMGMDHARLPEFKAGKEICEVFCEGGFSSVHRTRFLDEMVALLPQHVRDHCVTFGARLVSVEEVKRDGGSTAVNLTCANGTTTTADVVIGCDGVKSQLRRIVLGDDSPQVQPVFTGKYAYRGLIPMDKAIAALGDRSARNAHHRVGYNGHVLTFPIDNGNTMNVVAFRTKEDGKWEHDEWVVSASKEEMQADFANWGDDVHAILGLMERCDKWALYDHPPAGTYRHGRVCLMGDAAHASTPHQGAGAGMAIEDAYVMSGILSEIHESRRMQSVFLTFDATRKERTQRLVRTSREQAMIYDFQAPGIEDDVHKIADVLPSRWDWIWDYDVELALATAKMLMDPHVT